MYMVKLWCMFVGIFEKNTHTFLLWIFISRMNMIIPQALLDSKVYIEKQLLIIYFNDFMHYDAPMVQKLCENLLREFGKCKLNNSYYTFYMFFNLISHH
jgi:hypothetical protein